MKNIKHWLDIIDPVRDHMALGLMSDPGLSKTSQINQWAEEHKSPSHKGGRKVFSFVTSQRMPSEISGMAMPDNEERRMSIYDFDYLLGMQDGDILFFDEFTNGNIMTLNACLTLIQDRMMISGKQLPSIIVIAAGNPQGRCDLLPQTKQRFMWVDVVYDSETWTKYIKDTWGFRVEKKLDEYIREQYRNGFDTKKYNYFTPRTVENLLRLATTIPKDDIFWEQFEGVDNNFKEALYNTVLSKDRYETIKTGTIGWVEWLENCEQEEGIQKHLKELKTALEAAESWMDLEIIIKGIEESNDYDDVGKKFIDWLKKDEEADPLNPYTDTTK